MLRTRLWIGPLLTKLIFCGPKYSFCSQEIWLFLKASVRNIDTNQERTLLSNYHVFLGLLSIYVWLISYMLMGFFTLNCVLNVESLHLPGNPVVQILYFHCRGQGWISGPETKILPAAWNGQNNNNDDNNVESFVDIRIGLSLYHEN